MTVFLLILAVLLGLAPGMIAHGKGRHFFVWWVYGVVLGPIALLHAMLLRGAPRPAFAAAPRRPRTRWDTPWPLLLWAACSFAVAIIAIAAYRIVMPPDTERTADSREVSVSADSTPEKPQTSSPKAEAETVAPPILAAQPRPAPAVRVTIRQEDVGGNETPPVAPAPAAPTERPSPELASPEPAATPEPPAVPQQLERTMAKTAEPEPATEPGAAKVADVRVARAVPAPPDETMAAKPERAAKTRDHTRDKAPLAKRADPKPVASPSPTEVTAVGETVRVVQQALAERGYAPGPANGRAGRQTQLAIRKFQSDRGLSPTGTIDYAVLEQLSIVGPRVHAFQPPPGATPGR